MPIYALVDFGITRSQRLRETTTTTTAAAAVAGSATETTNGITSSGTSADASNAPPIDAKNLHGDEEVRRTIITSVDPLSDVMVQLSVHKVK